MVRGIEPCHTLPYLALFALFLPECLLLETLTW